MGGLFAVAGVLTAILFLVSAVGAFLANQQLQETAVKLGAELSASTQSIITISWVSLALYVVAGISWLGVAVFSLKSSKKKKK